MNVETHSLETDGGSYWEASEDKMHITNAMEARRDELETQGHRVLIVRTGGAHPLGFVAHTLTFLAMLEQSKRESVNLDLIFHTAGTGTALLGLIAGKIMLGHPVKFRSISIYSYEEGGFMSPSIIVERVKGVLSLLGAEVPPDHLIRAEIKTGKGFTGILDQLCSGKVAPGANVAFLHTGDTANVFEVNLVVGDVVKTVSQSK
ncbi:hypothetical protein NM208_g5604 [Fusarium decemcellulare]|uniref:Uncharacterized protein n=1 Tax=Fusarium decemcellulare TaxID=57161 RepID=A0ACC1SG81_9HYPO|nr:hypothetical protein NM208_g5604 [Fusarium decemcellulare]